MSDEVEIHRIGRPPAEISAEVVERAASIGCTPDEIAAVLGVGRSTMYDRMAADPEIKNAIERGRDKGRATLRRLQWQKANGGSDTMLIWLGKQMLEQRDHREITGANGGPIDVRSLSTEQLASLLASQATDEGDPPASGGTGTPTA